MPELLLMIIVVMIVVVFAIIGLGICLARLFRAIFRKTPTAAVRSPQHSHQSSVRTAVPRHSLKEDVLASRRLLDHLLLTGQITQETHQRLRGFLAKRFAGELGMAPIKRPVTATPGDLSEAPELDFDPAKVDSKSHAALAAASNAPAASPVSDVPVAKLVSQSAPSLSAEDGVGVGIVDADISQPATARQPAGVAPWDQPDPPPRTPRRSFAEVMSVFMQEKNMRWGELTSGILIVMSACRLGRQFARPAQ